MKKNFKHYVFVDYHVANLNNWLQVLQKLWLL